MRHVFYFFCRSMSADTDSWVQHAIDLAQEAFPELRDVNRELICFEVRVVVSQQSERRTARIGRTAWPVVLDMLTRFEIVDVLVASPPQANAVAQPPPYASEAGWRADKKESHTDPASSRPQASYPQSHPHSITTRVVELFRLRSSRDHQQP